MTDSKVVVICPWYDYEEPETGVSVRTLKERFGWPDITVRGSPCIDLLRSELATKAIHDGFEWLLWVDNDMDFNPLDMPFLLRSAIANGAQLMAVMYTTKQPGGRPTVYPEGSQVVFGKFGSVVPIHRCGFGLTLTHRSAFTMVASSLPDVAFRRSKLIGKPFFLPMVVQEEGSSVARYFGEDYSFCYRLKTAGGKLVCDTHFRAGHFGRYSYQWGTMGSGGPGREPDDLTVAGQVDQDTDLVPANGLPLDTKY